MRYILCGCKKSKLTTNTNNMKTSIILKKNSILLFYVKQDKNKRYIILIYRKKIKSISKIGEVFSTEVIDERLILIIQ